MRRAGRSHDSAPSLPFGRARLPVPRRACSWTQLLAPGLSALARPEAAFARVARAAAARAAAAAGGGPLAVVVPDRTRPAMLPAFLPALLAALDEAGIGPDRLTLVPASGIHRPMSRRELAIWVGEAAARSGARLAPHDADAPCAALGTSRDGLEVAVHRNVAESAAIVAVGRIVFHYLAGFGGGRKLLVPGVASRRTVLAAHSFTVCGGRRAAGARPGRLAGNRFHGVLLRALDLFPPATFVNLATSLDGRLAAATSGGPARHVELCRRYRRAHRCEVALPLDGIVVAAGGAPTDRDLVQAHKALDAVAPVVRPGGRILLVAECGDGVGNRELEEAFAIGGAEAIRAALAREFRVGWQTAASLREKAERFKVFALTRLPAPLARAAGLHPVGTLEEGIERLREGGNRLAIAPFGARLLYELAPRAVGEGST